MAMDKDGNIDLQAAQLVYKSWKAKGDWIAERLIVADLKAMISDAEVLYWEFFDITMGSRRDPKDRHRGASTSC